MKEHSTCTLFSRSTCQRWTAKSFWNDFYPVALKMYWHTTLNQLYWLMYYFT